MSNQVKCTLSLSSRDLTDGGVTNTNPRAGNIENVGVTSGRAEATETEDGTVIR
jgi:hypothetical protein